MYLKTWYLLTTLIYEKKKLFFSETESLNFIAVLAQLQNGVLDGRLLSCGIISSEDKSILPVR